MPVNQLGNLSHTAFDSVGIGWGLKARISNRLLARTSGLEVLSLQLH